MGELSDAWRVNLFYDHHGANTEAATLEIQVLPSLLTQTAFSLAH